MMKRVIVTGHTGFIGSALVASLNRLGGFEVEGVSQRFGIDLDKPGALDGLSGADAVVNLAASVGPRRGWSDPYGTYRNNFLTVLGVLQFAAKHHMPVIQMSSYVYGQPQYLPVDEMHPVCCTGPYAESKRIGEILCESFHRDFNIPVAMLRVFNVYGPGQTGESLVSHIVQQALEGREIVVRDLEPRRDYLYIDDLVSAIVAVINAGHSGSGFFNIGAGVSHSVSEVIDLVQSVAGTKLSVRCTGDRLQNEIPDCFADSSLFRQRFTWRPVVGFHEGIRKTIAQWDRRNEK